MANYDKTLYQTPLYKSWASMKSRCLNKNGVNYKEYGGRGIGISKEWLYFSNFSRDMQASFKKNSTLERLDNNANYCKENCKWATRKEQANNRRSSRFLTIKGEKKTLAKWIDMSGLKSSTVRQRFYCYKWPVERCFNYQF